MRVAGRRRSVSVADRTELGGFPLIGGWSDPGLPDRGGGAAYGEMIEALRDFLDKVAAAKPDEATTRALAGDLADWSARLTPLAVAESEQIFAHRHDLPGRGQVMSPALIVDGGDAGEVRGHVTFGRYYLGGNGAVHGGAIPLLFDELLGRLANSGGRGRSRTAYLHINYRSITPIETQLRVRGWMVSEAGRKRLLRAELHDGETLCADAEGLFVELKPGQP
jgi:acyl-coenzyme A thioesterase PaaI-like protein